MIIAARGTVTSRSPRATSRRATTPRPPSAPARTSIGSNHAPTLAAHARSRGSASGTIAAARVGNGSHAMIIGRDDTSSARPLAAAPRRRRYCGAVSAVRWIRRCNATSSPSAADPYQGCSSITSRPAWIAGSVAVSAAASSTVATANT